MIKKSSVLLISLVATALATVALGRAATKPHHKPQKATTLPAQTRYLPEYTGSGELVLPKNNIWRDWVYLGSPLTPNALNGGKAGFPEYHNVYMEPGSYESTKRRARFPRGRSCSRNCNLQRHPHCIRMDRGLSLRGAAISLVPSMALM